MTATFSLFFLFHYNIKIESDGTGTYEVSDIRFDGASRNFLYLLSYGDFKDIKKFYSFTLEQDGGLKKTRRFYRCLYYSI